VEGYDISNISGTEATGSMVVFIKGFPKKSEYRKFRIKSVTGPNDLAMMQEVIHRRLQHPEWVFPDIMIIDGGKAQLGVVLRELRNVEQESPINAVGLAKREEELYIPGRKKPVLLRTLPREAELFFEHVRNESHRFAKQYHHKLREISYRINANEKTL
jgi:excinuclease ABC subunit C